MGSETPKKRRPNRQERESWRAAHPIRSSLPFLALAGLILTTLVTVNTCTVCYAVDAQGEKLAFFQWEGTYQSAVSQAEAKASRILDTDYSFGETVTVRTAVAPKDRIEALPEVTNSLLEIIPELKHVYTLSVDGVMVGAALLPDTIEQALSIVKAHYTTPDTLSVHVENQVNLRYEYLPAETPTYSAQELAALLLAQSPRLFSYTVQPGDTLEKVLETFSMTQERLQELNPQADLTAQVLAMGIDLAENSEIEKLDGEDFAKMIAAEFGTPLEEGSVLTVEQLCPLLVVSTVEEQKLTRPVTPGLETQPDDTMFTGEQRIIQEGQLGEAAVLARVVKRCGVPVASTDLTSVVTTEAQPILVGTGTRPMPELPEGLFLWPIQGRLTSDYGYRFIFGGTNFHRGVDLAAPSGTAINAAADGVVTFAGVKGTYGNLVILSHGDGFQTYYAHCSKLLVEVGEEVTQGQPIAAVGSTGRSTGPHLHFEVRYQNSLLDPLLYLPGENNAPFREELTGEEEDETAEEEPIDGEAPEEGTLPEEGETPENTEPPAEETPVEEPEPELPPEPETPEVPALPEETPTPPESEPPAPPEEPTEPEESPEGEPVPTE